MDLTQDITIELIPKANVELEPSHETIRRIGPPPSKCTLTTEFRVRAVALGKGEVWITAKQDGYLLAMISLTFAILDATATTMEDGWSRAEALESLVHQGHECVDRLTIIEVERGNALFVFVTNSMRLLSGETGSSNRST